MAKRQGLTEEQIAELPNFRESTILTPREKAAVWYAEVLAGDHTQASEALFNELRRYFSEAEIIDLGFRITAFVGYARLIRVLGWKGAVCVRFQTKHRRSRGKRREPGLGGLGRKCSRARSTIVGGQAVRPRRRQTE